MCTLDEVADYQPPSPQNESSSEREEEREEDRESTRKHWYSLSLPQRTPEHFIVDEEGRAQEAPPISEGAPAITGSWRKEVIFFAGIATNKSSVLRQETQWSTNKQRCGNRGN